MSKFIQLAGALALAAFVGLPAMADEAPERPKPSTEKPEEPKVAEITLPWTQEEVVAASKKGVAYRFEIAAEGSATGSADMEISDVTDSDFLMTSLIVVDGHEIKEEPIKKTWDEHLNGLKKRLKGSSVSQESIEVGAGKFECTLYTKSVEDENSKKSEKMWLSKDLPGMMIKAERYSSRGGKVDSESWSLVSHDILRVKLPWSVKEIAASWKDGVSMKYNASNEGGDAGWVQMVMSDVTETGFTEVTIEALGGRPEKTSEPSKRTWDRYLREIAVPRHNATVTEESIEVKAGKFECMVVTIVEKGEKSSGTQKLWIAKKEPGLLVKMSIDGMQNGKPDKEGYELVEFKKGK